MSKLFHVFIFIVVSIQDNVNVFSKRELSSELKKLWGNFAITGRGVSCAEQQWNCQGADKIKQCAKNRKKYAICLFSVQQRLLKRRCDITELRATFKQLPRRPFVVFPRDLSRRQLQLSNVERFADWLNVNLIDVCSEHCILEGNFKDSIFRK